MSFLDEILKRKSEEVRQKITCITLQELADLCKTLPKCESLKAVLDFGAPPRIIAEIKRASPSKGHLKPDLDAAWTALTYSMNGAAAISILTDGPGFCGILDDIRAVRAALDARKNISTKLPILRKDFIIDPYQLWESRAAGADAVLLIAAALEKSALRDLMIEAYKIGLEPLVEAHNDAEFQTALEIGANIIGVNNRDLRTFAVDPETTLRVARIAPKEITLVAESGITAASDIKKYIDSGVRAFLIGEALVTAPDIGAKLREFISYDKNTRGDL